jgi:hypothetical protein
MPHDQSWAMLYVSRGGAGMSVFTHRVPAGAVESRPKRGAAGGRVRRVALTIFFTSVVVNATLGIYAVLAPDFGETQAKVLATSLCVTGAVLVALACEPAWERGLLGHVPHAGAALGAIGFSLTIVGMWGEIDSDVYGKLMGTSFVAGAGCTAASLLALARLAGRHRWVFRTALVLLTISATMVAVMLWLGTDPPAEYARALGVVAIAFAAFAVTVPVLHWVDRGALRAIASSSSIRYCPCCGKALTGEAGVPVACERCGAAFVVRLS